jgi:hypothetical protein
VLFCDQYFKLFILYPVLNYFVSNKTIEVFFSPLLKSLKDESQYQKRKEKVNETLKPIFFFGQKKTFVLCFLKHKVFINKVGAHYLINFT